MTPDTHPSGATLMALHRAYERPCFVCRKVGACGHREPDVEVALLRAVQRADNETRGTQGMAAIA